MFERRDIWKLSGEDPWHPTIEWYARAADELRSRNGESFADPTSWGYLAAVHGTDIPRTRWPRGATWNACQHASWYFLPWHRIYLHYFETVVRAAVAKLGGPGDWALPYWDYSDPGRGDVRMLPPAFTQPTMPSGEPNPLYTDKRAAGMNDGGKLPASAVLVDDAMRERVFADPNTGGFGGAVTGWNDAGGVVGSLENVPHGGVHMGVGGRNPLGWMSRFQTAGSDPVFWLHHCNLDRLWEAWLAQADVKRANPTAARWRGMRFTIGSGDSAVTLEVRNVVDTEAAPLGYRYESLALPGVLRRSKAARRPSRPIVGDVQPEMVGATEERISLGAAPSDAVVVVSAPTGPALKFLSDVEEELRRVYIKVENVEGSDLAASSYMVHVNLPAGADAADHPERRAGQISMFGVPEASRGDERHGGGGLTFSFEISAVARGLEDAGDWDPERLRVTFTPVRSVARGGQGEAGPREGGVSAGRVSLFYT